MLSLVNVLLECFPFLGAALHLAQLQMDAHGVKAAELLAQLLPGSFLVLQRLVAALSTRTGKVRRLRFLTDLCSKLPFVLPATGLTRQHQRQLSASVMALALASAILLR